MARTKNYSDFLTRFASMIGYEVADLETAELTIINSFFNKAMKQIWQAANWMDVSIFGEYRVPNNQLTFASRFENSAWTKTNVTTVNNTVANPVDIQSNSDQILETVATGTHGASQSVTVNASATACSVFAQSTGRTWIQLAFTDSGSTVYSGFFNLVAGSIGTLATGVTATMNQISGNWFQCTINFTPVYGSGTFAINLSTDGSTTSYAGSTSSGAYLWGASVVPTAPSGVSTQLIPWEQKGENAIDVLFPGGVYNMTPLATSYPSRSGYKLTSNGIQIINSTTGWNAMYYVQNPSAAATTTAASPLSPVYLDYRKRVPDYSGATYAAGTTYNYGDQFYYTANNGASNYYQALQTTVGNTPDAQPTYFTALTIPYVFFDYAAESVFADWLRTEGQIGKAQIQDARAQDIMDRESDRQERQMGGIMPWRVHTHLTSRPNASR